jgi:endonuclease/exonuclease/phosphatase family metal-dependent hydrolase
MVCHRRLKLLTYNIHSGIGRDGRYDLDRIGDLLEEEAPDVIALQEVNRGMHRTNRDDQPRLLANRLKMNEYFSMTTRRDGGEFGLCVLSTFTLLHRQEYDITYNALREPRMCVRVDIDLGDRSMLHIFNCHLGLAKNERVFQREQMISAAILLAEDVHHPVVLMGDFNDKPVSVVHRQLRTHFNDTFKALGKRSPPTFRYGLLRLRLDHVYVSPDLLVLDAWVKKAGTAQVASDHRPVVSMIEVKLKTTA